MNVLRKTTVVAIALVIGYVLGQSNSSETVTIETAERTVATTIAPSVQEILEVITRDVPAPVGDQYPCFLALSQDDPTMPWSAIMNHVERKWAGNACAALDHLVAHGWY
jgi:hypothetical protein